MNIIKCQYCGGKHQDTDENKKWTCSYCDRENKPNKNLLRKINKWLLENHEHLGDIWDGDVDKDSCFVNSEKLEKFLTKLLK